MVDVPPMEELPRPQYGAALYTYEVTGDADFSALGLSQHAARFGRGRLDALFHNKESDVLVVSLHGAVDRMKYTAPRFERFRTLSRLPHSVLYLSDPALALDPALGLAWYVGYDEQNTVEACVDWIERAAAASGANQVLITGSSGGGYGALQMSRLIPRSMALVFQPQTLISRYYASYVSVFADHCFPQLGSRWEEELGKRVSVLEAYRQPGLNHVRYVQNRNDRSHYLHHFKPFLKALNLELGPNSSTLDEENISVRIYDGPPGHKVPTPDLFLDELNVALSYLARLVP